MVLAFTYSTIFSNKNNREAIKAIVNINIFLFDTSAFIKAKIIFKFQE